MIRGLIERTWRRAKEPSVPEEERCSFCPKRYVMSTTRPIYDDPDGRPAREEIRRCIDHPPDWAPEGTCPDCGWGYWPDLLHLDCPSEPTTETGDGRD